MSRSGVGKMVLLFLCSLGRSLRRNPKERAGLMVKGRGVFSLAFSLELVTG